MVKTIVNQHSTPEKKGSDSFLIPFNFQTFAGAFMSLSSQINLSKVPEHVAVIMDGNGRWAKKQGEMRIFGHASGVESVREVLKGATEIGIKYLTLYAFSTENWNRPEEEVSALMDLLVQTIANEVETLNDNGVRLNAIGDLESLPGNCHAALKEAIDKTSQNDRITLTLALSYSSRWEITQAVQRIAEDVHQGKVEKNDIDDKLISSYMNTANMPDPELLIRTSGESRISNYLLWQLAYTELYFTDILWPDFNREQFYQAILDYQGRERRFGKVSEQIDTEC